jgi:hypothetical protein
MAALVSTKNLLQHGSGIVEFRDVLEAVKRHDTCGSYVRDAFDIRIAVNSQRTANLVLAPTIVAAICGAIQTLGVFWMIFHTH